MKRFTLYGSPHSLPTYKVALMLRMSGEPFSFRYVSFQKSMHKSPEFRALSRWGQVPVLIDGARAHFQSGAIVEYLADVLARFRAPDVESSQAVREWLYWDVDTLYPPIYGCYSVLLDQRKLLPLNIEPAIADYHRRRADAALSLLDAQLVAGPYLCASEPTVADLFCCADVAYAELCEFDLSHRPHVATWMARIRSLDGFTDPFDLLRMEDHEIA
jgi:glutathione S-transferase